ncbi:MAG TPA: TonB-dependent receptor [Bryobacteraceae bacterium]
MQSSPTSSVAGQTIGFPYASFLLGLVDTANVHPSSDARLGKQQWGFYVQDNWKVTRKLTLDIGLRYDYSTRFKEQYGRSPNFSPATPNPSSGGHPGAVIYEATCKCEFGKNYPWAFGPRFGLAYQITPKTVLRAGFGIAYTGTPQYNLGGGAISATTPIGPSPTAGLPIMTLRGGVPLTAAQIAWPNLDVGFYPINSIVGAGPAQTYDQNSGRPARQYQWSIGLQREVVRNLVVEASYVANRGIWWTNNTLVNYNYVSNAILSANGLSLNNPADLTILSAQLGSAAAGRFQNRVPFAGFPLTATVAQSLRPFPQFSSGLAGLASPLGDSWYDSLQARVNKRFSHGLDFTYAFTWAKQLDNFGVGTPAVATTPDIQNRALAKTLSSLDQPFVSGLGVNYTLPRWGKNRVLAFAVRDWTVGGFFQYASGTPIPPPAANRTPTLNTLVFQNTNVQNRVPGVPLFTQDLNCHCFDPSSTFVLNPAAWANPEPGQFGSGTLYNDYRYQRRPVENLSIGRMFRIHGERTTLNIRAEFTNVLNRTEVNNPSVTNPQTAQTRSANGTTTAGFGFINNTTTAVAPRQGQIVAQFRF